jgi:hypothetical protein
MTDLEQLQAALKAALERHADNVSWLEQGATFDHSKLELERAVAESEASLEQAKRDLAAYLACPLESSHGPLTIEWNPYGQRYMCSCGDCADGEPDPETGYMRATNPIGYGRTESEAFEDLYESVEINHVRL